MRKETGFLPMRKIIYARGTTRLSEQEMLNRADVVGWYHIQRVGLILDDNPDGTITRKNCWKYLDDETVNCMLVIEGLYTTRSVIIKRQGLWIKPRMREVQHYARHWMWEKKQTEHMQHNEFICSLLRQYPGFETSNPRWI